MTFRCCDVIIHREYSSTFLWNSICAQVNRESIGRTTHSDEYESRRVESLGSDSERETQVPHRGWGQPGRAGGSLLHDLRWRPSQDDGHGHPASVAVHAAAPAAV